MNREETTQSTKGRLEYEASLGHQWLFDKRGMPRFGFIVLLVGFTAILVLLAAFAYWMWWIPAGIFVFILVMMSFSFFMVRHQRRKGEKE